MIESAETESNSTDTEKKRKAGLAGDFMSVVCATVLKKSPPAELLMT